MLALVLSANLFADAVQHALDPRTRTLKQHHIKHRSEKKYLLATSKIDNQAKSTNSL